MGKIDEAIDRVQNPRQLVDRSDVRILIAEVEWLREQRDRAWRALAEIEGMITPGDLRFALSLAGSRGPDDCDEWNRVTIQAAGAEGDEDG